MLAKHSSRRVRPGGGHRRRWVVAVVVAALVSALTGVFAARGSAAPSYRTTSVERADVDATLDAVGTIQPVNMANLSFPVAGTVGSVSVALGQHVVVGQILAQLDTTSLDAQVASAQSTVAAAAARLAADESSQISGTVTAAVAPTAFSTELTSPGNAPAAGTGSSDPASAARDALIAQQALLVTDQHQADQDLAQEKRDFATETSRCQAFLTAAPTSATAPTSPPWRAPRSRSTVVTPPAGTTAPSSPDPSACESAITTVVADQVAVNHDQQALTADLPALGAAIDKLLTSRNASTQPQPVPSTRPQPVPSTSPQPSATTRSAASSAGRAVPPARSAAGSLNRTASALRPTPQPASPEQLASDQAAIDAAQAQLAEAQQAHDQAELLSPIDGTVGSVTISAGQSVQPSSGTAQIVVLGAGSHQVITSASDTTVGSVRVSDAVTITPSGAAAPLRGQVVSVGLLGSAGSGTSGSVSYPVTIGLTDTGQQLFAGQSASVSIMLAHASGTLTVPSSAVHTVGATSTVTVLRAGTPHNVQVTLGAIGPIRTQILAGLNLGDQVVLADLSQPLPNATPQNVRSAVPRGGAAGG